MKQITVIFLLFTLLNSNLLAQNNPVNKKNSKKALNIEIIDISGEKHSGKLWYVDSSRIVISDKVFNTDSLKLFTSDQIYSLKITKKGSFVKTLLITTSLVGVVTAASLISTCDACMIGPGLIIAGTTIIYGLPLGAVAGTFVNFIPPKKIEYITNSSDSAYQISVESMQKNIKIKNDYTLAKENIILKDEKKINDIKEPLKKFHPYSNKKIHIEFTTDFHIIDPLNGIEDIYKTNNITFYELNLRTEKFSGNLSYNVSKHLQLFAGYSYGSGYKTYGEAYVEIDTFKIWDKVIFEQQFQSATVGFNYVFNPVNNLLVNRFQFDAGIGFTMYKIDYLTNIYTIYDEEAGNHAIIDKTTENTYFSQGIKLNTNMKYFVHKNISINTGFYYDIIKNISIENITETAISGRSFGIQGYDINFSALYIKLGVEFHF